MHMTPSVEYFVRQLGKKDRAFEALWARSAASKVRKTGNPMPVDKQNLAVLIFDELEYEPFY